MSYKTKAKKFSKCNFRIYGLGNFDTYDKDVALIFKLVEKNDFDSLYKLYLKLEKERL